MVVAQPSLKVKVIGDDKLATLDDAAGLHLLTSNTHQSYRLNTEALKFIKDSSPNNKQLVQDALRLVLERRARARP